MRHGGRQRGDRGKNGRVGDITVGGHRPVLHCRYQDKTQQEEKEKKEKEKQAQKQEAQEGKDRRKRGRNDGT